MLVCSLLVLVFIAFSEIALKSLALPLSKNSLEYKRCNEILKNMPFLLTPRQLSGEATLQIEPCQYTGHEFSVIEAEEKTFPTWSPSFGPLPTPHTFRVFSLFKKEDVFYVIRFHDQPWSRYSFHRYISGDTLYRRGNLLRTLCKTGLIYANTWIRFGIGWHMEILDKKAISKSTLQSTKLGQSQMVHSRAVARTFAKWHSVTVQQPKCCTANNPGSMHLVKLMEESKNYAAQFFPEKHNSNYPCLYWLLNENQIEKECPGNSITPAIIGHVMFDRTCLKLVPKEETMELNKLTPVPDDFDSIYKILSQRWDKKPEKCHATSSSLLRYKHADEVQMTRLDLMHLMPASYHLAAFFWSHTDFKHGTCLCDKLEFFPTPEEQRNFFYEYFDIKDKNSSYNKEKLKNWLKEIEIHKWLVVKMRIYAMIVEVASKLEAECMRVYEECEQFLKRINIRKSTLQAKL